MKRRSFLAALFAAPALPVVAKVMEGVPSAVGVPVVNPTKAALPTSFVVDASQFIIEAGENLNAPFLVDGDVIRMNLANISEVSAGVIRHGNMVVDLGARTITDTD